MLLPGIFDEVFGRNDFDNLLKGNGYNKVSQMQSDIIEYENGYRVNMELPGFQKEEVKAELKDGYMTIYASHSENKEEKEGGKYIRRERFSGSCQRSFYVGEDVTQEDIQAKFKDGILSIDIPKKEALPKREEKKYIAIE